MRKLAFVYQQRGERGLGPRSQRPGGTGTRNTASQGLSAKARNRQNRLISHWPAGARRQAPQTNLMVPPQCPSQTFPETSTRPAVLVQARRPDCCPGHGCLCSHCLATLSGPIPTRGRPARDPEFGAQPSRRHCARIPCAHLAPLQCPHQRRLGGCRGWRACPGGTGSTWFLAEGLGNELREPRGRPGAAQTERLSPRGTGGGAGEPLPAQRPEARGHFRRRLPEASAPAGAGLRGWRLLAVPYFAEVLPNFFSFGWSPF